MDLHWRDQSRPALSPSFFAGSLTFLSRFFAEPVSGED
jgi:hypothetical protein